MIFNAEHITLTEEDKAMLGETGRRAFSWSEVGLLQAVIQEAFETELECEFQLFDSIRTACDSTETAFNSPVLHNFSTYPYRLGHMLNIMEHVSEVE